MKLVLLMWHYVLLKKIMVILLHRNRNKQTNKKIQQSIVYVYMVNVSIQEGMSEALWPHTGLWEGEEGTSRRNRTGQSGDLLVPSTGCDSAPESQHQLCATLPGTEEKQKRQKKKIEKQEKLCQHFHHKLDKFYSESIVSPIWWKVMTLTSLQRKVCLLVTEVTRINSNEMSRRIICLWGKPCSACPASLDRYKPH